MHETNEPPAPAYILAGGRSSRFGRDKARAVIRGESLLARIARMVAPVVSDVTVIADERGKYADLGLKTIRDHRLGLGPLAGLETALLHHGSRRPRDTDWLLLLSCDLVHVEPDWVRRLHDARSPGLQVIAYRTDRCQPFVALYHSTTIDHVKTRLDRGELSLLRCIDGVTSKSLTPPSDWPDPFQINTVADLERTSRQP